MKDGRERKAKKNEYEKPSKGKIKKSTRRRTFQS